VLSSPYVKTHVLFVKPESSDLPAGRLVKMLVGFHNNGTSNFVVDSIDGSFRYPQDFSYYIQNFSTFDLSKVVETQREATFEYMFTPSETFSSRQFGLTINLRYKSLVSGGFYFKQKPFVSLV
jgi:translocon-associated protein subunit alpha